MLMRRASTGQALALAVLRVRYGRPHRQATLTASRPVARKANCQPQVGDSQMTKGDVIHFPNRTTGAEPAGGDGSFFRREPDGCGLDSPRDCGRFGNSQRATEESYHLLAAGEGVQHGGHGPKQCEQEIAETEADQIGKETGDRLCQAVENLESGDDEGILLRREMRLVLKHRRAGMPCLQICWRCCTNRSSTR